MTVSVEFQRAQEMAARAMDEMANDPALHDRARRMAADFADIFRRLPMKKATAVERAEQGNAVISVGAQS